MGNMPNLKPSQMPKQFQVISIEIRYNLDTGQTEVIAPHPTNAARDLAIICGAMDMILGYMAKAGVKTREEMVDSIADLLKHKQDKQEDASTAPATKESATEPKEEKNVIIWTPEHN